MRMWLALALVLASGNRPAGGDEPKSKAGTPPRAPADFQIFEHDMAGAYFIAPQLMEKYQTIRSRVAGLRAEIDGGRIDGSKARSEVATLQAELNKLLETIDRLRWALDRTVALGLSDMMLHAGFLPELDDPGRSAMLDTLAKAGQLAAEKGVTLAFETGQETADLLRRTLDDLNAPNLKVHFDQA